MNCACNKGSKWFRVNAGWCALLLYVGACSSPGTVLAALAGLLDPAHQLLVNAGARGSQVVLHHSAPYTSHRHGIAARVLTIFSQAQSAANPDHVLQFCSVDTLKGHSRTSTPQPEVQRISSMFSAGEHVGQTTTGFVRNIFADAALDVSQARLCLRSTVLLI